MICVLSKMAFLTFLGIAAVVLIGPGLGLVGVALGLMGAALGLVVAVICVALPFAFIGVLVWLPFHLFDKGRRSRQQLNRLRYAQFQYQRQSGMGGAQAQSQRQTAMPPAAQRCVGAVRRSTNAAWQHGRTVGRTIGGVLMETLYGAATLGILAGLVATELPHHQAAGYVMAGIGLGAIFGFLIGLANYGASRHDLCKDGPGEP